MYLETIGSEKGDSGRFGVAQGGASNQTNDR